MLIGTRLWRVVREGVRARGEPTQRALCAIASQPAKDVDERGSTNDGFSKFAYSEDYANGVMLPGVVYRNPELLGTPDGRSQRAKLHVLTSSPARRYPDPITVTFFGPIAHRVVKHVRRLDEVVVRGVLTSFQGRAEVVGDHLAFLEPGSGPVSRDAAEKYEAERVKPESKGEGKPALAPSKLRCLECYNQGMKLEDIADKLKLKPATVLGYLGDCYGGGMKVDLKRLCADALLGKAGSKTFVEIDSFAKVIQEEGGAQGGIGRSAAQRIINGVKTLVGREKLDIQDEVGKERGTGQLIYAQIKIVAGMLNRGLTSKDWGHLLLEDDNPPF